METTPKSKTPVAANFTGAAQKIDDLLKQDTITNHDFECLSAPERQYLSQACTDILAKLKDAERDNFLEKISPVITPETKSDIWDYNHTIINNAVITLMRQYGTMPGKKAIAEKTGLSRQTVAKHLKEYQRQPDFTAEMQQFKFMAPNVLTSVFNSALNGDMKAARLYLEMVGAANKQRSGTVINEQNNYLQINNTILSQENLKHLTPAQLNQIESIINDNR
ncbi:hypothetical protein [Mucilaginibacter sp. AK015]|uniref:hypothetical protein n=1 Tax=Mucilaginibacter sp. AK015 TaxID=2723072 RepID=UPI001622CBEF|nr:hypothetical protein [Mucilaginibacter sp. AK015]MBB5395323.1 hypothetical protein [Mucilaginibacter sp. AK015]